MLPSSRRVCTIPTAKHGETGQSIVSFWHVTVSSPKKFTTISRTHTGHYIIFHLNHVVDKPHRIAVYRSDIGHDYGAHDHHREVSTDYCYRRGEVRHGPSLHKKLSLMTRGTQNKQCAAIGVNDDKNVLNCYMCTKYIIPAIIAR